MEKRWDVGRKLFACRKSPDVFGYAGEVLFPSLALGQVTDAADHGLLFGSDVEADIRHAIFVDALKTSFSNRHNAPDFGFTILHAARVASNMTATFRLWQLSYNPVTKLWADEEITIDVARSDLLLAVGSGAKKLEGLVKESKALPQGRTSRATFWAFCDALKSQSDPLSGGAPQLIGMYRTEFPKIFGIIYNGQRYFDGLPLRNDVRFDGVEWRDENFQRIDGTSMRLLDGAQRHVR